MDSFDDPVDAMADIDYADESGDFETSFTDILDDREDAATLSRKRSRDEEEEVEGPNGLGIHMSISQEEREWARALKHAALEGEDTKDIVVSDMEFAQLGIVESGNVAKALDRIHKLHLFRTTYQIEDTVEHGLQCIREFMEQQPGFHLNLDQCPRGKHFVHVLDFAKFHPKKIQLEKDWKVFLSGVYYFMQSLNPTLSAVRNGVLLMMEGDSMGWDNFCIGF